MLPAPAHVNQFSAGGVFRSGRFKGTSSAPWDCLTAVGAMMLDASTGGRVRLSTTDFRARQRDQDHNGIGLEDVALAFRQTPGAPTFSRGPSSWSAIAARLERADPVAVTGSYSRLGTYRASSYTGRHGLYLQRMAAGQVVANDPLRQGPTSIPEEVVRRFVDGAGWTSGGSGDAGGGSDPIGDWLRGVTVDWATGKTVAQLLGPPLTAGASDALRRRLVELGISTDAAHVITRPEAERIVAAGQIVGPGLGFDVAAFWGGATELALNGAVLVVVVALGWAGVKRLLGSAP